MEICELKGFFGSFYELLVLGVQVEIFSFDFYEFCFLRFFKNWVSF